MGMKETTLTFKEGGVLTISTTASNECGSWDSEYIIDDDELMWDGIEFDILKLNKKKLILEETEDETEDYIYYSFTEHIEFDRE